MSLAGFQEDALATARMALERLKEAQWYPDGYGEATRCSWSCDGPREGFDQTEHAPDCPGVKAMEALKALIAKGGAC